MIKHLVPEKWDLEVDLVAVGSSAGGLVAAIMACDLGLSAVVLEKSDVIGGATAFSGGATWIPLNHHMAEVGCKDTRDGVLQYVRGLSMGHHDEALLAAYVDNGAEMLKYLEEHTPVRMCCEDDGSGTEYLADMPGGVPLGRKVWPDQKVVPGIMEAAEKKYPLVGKVAKDPVKYLIGPRGPWVMGRGLIGPLVVGCVERGVDIITECAGKQLIVDNGRVVGIRAVRGGRDFLVKANRGVLLATGGFEWNEEMNKRFIYSPPLHAYTCPTNEGDGHIMGMEVGAAVALMDHSIFQPGLSMATDVVGQNKRLYRPFIYGYPGMIMVNRYGQRCCNECFYPDMGRAFLEYDRITGKFKNVPIFFVCDQSFRDIFPVMTLKRGGTEVNEWSKKGDTVRALAEAIGVPGNGLEETISRFNHFAKDGKDPDFHRGESTFDRRWGEAVFPGRGAKAVLGPLEKPPFYAIELSLTTAGNLGGLVTNTNAQVIDVHGDVIPGLYGTSNATAMLILGHHYDSGSAQGKSMVFGYLAAKHMAVTHARHK